MASTSTLTYGPPSATGAVDALLATTRSILLKSKDYFNDAIFSHIPLLDFLNKSGKIKRQGGASILVPIVFGKNGSFKAYNKDDVIDVTGTEGLTLAY